jgi:Rod binding domain-containing protein
MTVGTKPLSQSDSASAELDMQKKRLLNSCKEFESVMISYMMKTMHDGVKWSEEHDNAREVYEDMLNQQMSKEIGKSSALGIGDMLYSKLEPRLEGQARQQTNHSGTGGPAVENILNKLKNNAD